MHSVREQKTYSLLIKNTGPSDILNNIFAGHKHLVSSQRTKLLLWRSLHRNGSNVAGLEKPHPWQMRVTYNYCTSTFTVFLKYSICGKSFQHLKNFRIFCGFGEFRIKDMPTFRGISNISWLALFSTIWRNNQRSELFWNSILVKSRILHQAIVYSKIGGSFYYLLITENRSCIFLPLYI